MNITHCKLKKSIQKKLLEFLVLNYEILSDLNNIDTEEWEKQYQGYIKLYTRNGVDEFCGYTLFSPPTQFEQCRENVYLPFKIRQGRITMAGQDFFFPEGQREHFEQAEYGEFRFKEGKLLLLRLLDKELNILERQ